MFDFNNFFNNLVLNEISNGKLPGKGLFEQGIGELVDKQAFK